MKKFFEKYDLIKISGILVLISVLLTWVIPYGYFSGSDMVIEDITRVGLADFMQYGLLGMYYFTVLVTFLFVLGGFYQVLSKTAGYQKLIKGICEKLKGREIPFVLAISFVLAAICSVANEYFPILVLIPFIITILHRLKVDKISAFSATFGALLVGTIGSTFSTKVVGFINDTLGSTVDTYLLVKILIFLFAYVALNIFTCARISKSKKDKKFEEYDKFEVDNVKSTKKNAVIWPYIVCAILIFVTIVLAYFPWSTWEVTAFEDATNWVNELSLFGVPIISYVFSNFVSFGTWDIFTIQFVMLFATLLIHWFGKVSLDEVFESYGVGFKKMAPVVIVLLFVYMILEFAVMFPVVPVIVDWIASLADGFNAFLAFIAALITSLFGVEMQYVMSLAGTYYAATFAENTNVIAIIFQTAFGLISFIAPSSAILMMGLSYMNISYKEWFKYIWKFLLIMLVFVAIVITILVLV